MDGREKEKAGQRRKGEAKDAKRAKEAAPKPKQKGSTKAFIRSDPPNSPAPASSATPSPRRKPRVTTPSDTLSRPSGERAVRAGQRRRPGGGASRSGQEEEHDQGSGDRARPGRGDAQARVGGTRVQSDNGGHRRDQVLPGPGTGQGAYASRDADAERDDAGNPVDEWEEGEQEQGEEGEQEDEEGRVNCRVTIKTLPKQKAFLQSDADEVLYSGAYGAGKTLALCLKLVCRAMTPGAREGLFRQTLQDLYSTTLQTLLEGDGEMPAILPRGYYSINHQRRWIKIHGGGMILFNGLEDEDRIGSMNLTGAAVDEASELSQNAWLKIGGRLRVRAGNLKRQMYGACNPGPPSHHLAKRFGIRRATYVPSLAFAGDPTRPLRCEAICTNSFDNPHLPPDYLARLAAYTGVLRARYVLGEWVGSDGLIYAEWQRDVHCMLRRELWDHAYIAIDDGTSVPFAALLIMVDRDGGIHVAREVYRPGMEPAEKVRVVQDLRTYAKCPFMGCVVDPAAAGMKKELRDAGFVVFDGDNEVLTGISAVQLRLNVTANGRPGLTVDPGCVHLMEEMESYEWDTNFKGDKPVKANDHACDALRYLVMRLRRPAAAAVDKDTIKILKTAADSATHPFTGNLLSVLPPGVERDGALRKGDYSSVRFKVVEDGPWRVWCRLEAGNRPNQTRPYAVACSVGSGAPGSLTVIKCGDAELRTVIAQGEWRALNPENAARIAVMACLWMGGMHKKARLIWKHEGPGVAFGDAVRRLGFGNVHHHVDEDGQASDHRGWQWTKETGQALLGQFRSDLYGSAQGRYIESDPATATDLARWVFHPNGKLGPATLDADGETVEGSSDRAWAAMLLNHCMSFVSRMPRPKRQPEVGSVEWLERQSRHASEIKERLLKNG